MRQINVAILDDSVVTREALRMELEKDRSIKIVAKAATALNARDQIVDLQPDILICDVNLIGMNGVEFTKRLLHQYYMPVIMISSDPNMELISRAARAVDFIAKPTSGKLDEANLFYRRIIARIKDIVHQESRSAKLEKYNNMLIAIGASTGGTEALDAVIGALPCLMPPIVIAQHMPPKFTYTYAERLNISAKLSVKEASDDDTLLPGQVYIAPGGMHTVVRRTKNGLVLRMTPLDASSSLSPSVDRLFSSVDEATRGASIGVILTGMGSDGVEGLRRMHNSGSITIGQDEESSVVYGMPKVAYEKGTVDFRLPLGSIAEKLVELCD